MSDAETLDLSSPSQDVLVPAYEGRAVRVAKGDLIKLTNVEGQQIADFWAVNPEDTSEVLSTVFTRTHHFRIYPRTGDQFFSNNGRAMLTFVQDTSPGIHDMICHACSPYFIGMYGGDASGPSCETNFQKAMAAIGVDVGRTPDPVDFFQHTPVDEDGVITLLTSPADAGDYVLLRAEMHLIIATASCSFDLEVDGYYVNGHTNTPLRLEVFPA